MPRPLSRAHRRRFVSRCHPAFAALAAVVLGALAGCGVVQTTASVAKTTASVVAGTVVTTASVAKTGAEIGLKTVSTAATVGGAAVSAGSAAVSAGAAARSASAATVTAAIAGVTAVGGFVKWGIEFSREADRASAPLTPRGANEFVSEAGAVVLTRACDVPQRGDRAVIEQRNDAEFEVIVDRVAAAPLPAFTQRCPIVSVQRVKGS